MWAVPSRPGLSKYRSPTLDRVLDADRLAGNTGQCAPAKMAFTVTLTMWNQQVADYKVLRETESPSLRHIS
jgi:hypothetical protein